MLAEIREGIRQGRYKPGERVRESEVAAWLGVSRTPVREALQRLGRESLVVILPRRGILVSDINVGDQLRLLEVRRELERLMARAAADRASETERAEFSEIAQGMHAAAKTDDGIAFMRLDRALNLLVAEAARNSYASRAMGLMHGLSRRFWYQHYQEVADLPLCAQLHAELAMAIADGDREAAAAASDRLLDYIEHFTRATLDAGST